MAAWEMLSSDQLSEKIRRKPSLGDFWNRSHRRGTQNRGISVSLNEWEINTKEIKQVYKLAAKWINATTCEK
jgi:hypothetical protein